MPLWSPLHNPTALPRPACVAEGTQAGPQGTSDCPAGAGLVVSQHLSSRAWLAPWLLTSGEMTWSL